MKQLAIALFILLIALSSNAAPKKTEIDLSTLRRPAGAQLTPKEATVESTEQKRVREGLKLIEQGRQLAATKDGYSNLNKQTIDNSATRKRGEQLIDQGNEMVQTGAEALQGLYAEISGRTEQLAQQRESGLLRTWTNSEGRQLEASFVSLEGENLELQLTNGTTHSLPLSKLSDADQATAKLLSAGKRLTTADFIQATQEQDLATVDLYVASGYSPEETAIGDALSAASLQESSDLLQSMLNSDWNLNAHNSQGQSALSVATQHSQYINANSLMSAGASALSADSDEDGFTPLMWAAHTGDAKMLQLLAAESDSTLISPSLRRLLDIAESGAIQPLSTESLKQLASFDTEAEMPFQQHRDLNIALMGLAPTEDGLQFALSNTAYHPFVVEFSTYPFYQKVLASSPKTINELVKTWEAQDAEFNAAASYSLALCYLEGWAGTTNTTLALVYLKDAAENQSPPAMVLLAQLHESGQHVEQSEDIAKQLYQKASDLGFDISTLSRTSESE